MDLPRSRVWNGHLFPQLIANSSLLRCYSKIRCNSNRKFGPFFRETIMMLQTHCCCHFEFSAHLVPSRHHNWAVSESCFLMGEDQPSSPPVLICSQENDKSACRKNKCLKVQTSSYLWCGRFAVCDKFLQNKFWSFHAFSPSRLFGPLCAFDVFQLALELETKELDDLCNENV